MESHINLLLREGTDTGETGRGFGLVQWTLKYKLTDWTTLKGLEPNDIDVQLQQILVEMALKNDEKWNITRHNSGMTFKEFIQSTESVEKVAEIFCIVTNSLELYHSRYVVNKPGNGMIYLNC